ncbi:MAG TPA: metalloregulator ArsR/SmtB family transcription factor [Acidimicrobiales bacterium]|nr:metalloregulator ArsR/SmtB family transcription factor [Acidimicrobiales bacterium]
MKSASDSQRGELVGSRPLSEIKGDLFKALGHPGRVRILEVLRDGERPVGELIPLVGLEPSHLSQQLGVLRRAGVVTATRTGSSVSYSIADDAIVDLLDAARRFLITSLTATQELLAGLRDRAQ